MFLAQRMGAEKGVPGTKSPEQERGRTVVTGTYQYTTRTVSAIAARRIPAPREDPTHEQQGPQALCVGPCAQPTTSGVGANQVRGGKQGDERTEVQEHSGGCGHGRDPQRKTPYCSLAIGVVSIDGVPGTNNMRAPRCPFSVPQWFNPQGGGWRLRIG